MHSAQHRERTSVLLQEALFRGLSKGKGMMSNNSYTREYASSASECYQIVPEQFFTHIRVDLSSQPERRLMLAVLEEAIRTFQESISAATRQQRSLLAQAEEWFDSTDASWPFSFENICDTLGIEVEYLRTGLTQWKKIQLAQRQEPAWLIAQVQRARLSGRQHPIVKNHSASLFEVRATRDTHQDSAIRTQSEPFVSVPEL